MSWRERVRKELRSMSAYPAPKWSCAVKLDANESPFIPSPEFSTALAEAVQGAPLNRYPDAHASNLRALIAADLHQPEDRLVLGNGGDEIIGLLCQTFAEPANGQPRASIVYPAPGFVVFRSAAIAAGMNVVEASLGPRMEADAEDLSDKIESTNPNLVFLASPNNPTGTVWPRAVVEELVKSHPGPLWILDHAYLAYGGDDLTSLVESTDSCAVLRSYSKVGFAGLRIGVLIARPEVCAEIEKLRLPYNVGVLNQLAGALAIGRFRAELSTHVKEIVNERERVRTALEAMTGVEVFPSGANLLLMRVKNAAEVWRELVERSVLVRLFDSGRLAGCLRVTIGTVEENDRFLAALRAANPKPYDGD